MFSVGQGSKAADWLVSGFGRLMITGSPTIRVIMYSKKIVELENEKIMLDA